MEKFRVITSDKQEWTDILSKSLFFDFYHTSCYSNLSNQGKPILLVASINEDFIAFPLIIRNILDSSFFDCTSVYGYCGPISNLLDVSEHHELIRFFKESLIDYFEDKKIVSCFSRLHPIYENDKILNGLGEIVNLNKTIGIDLSLPLEEQRKKYRKSNKYEINKLRKNNYNVEIAKTDEEIDVFYEIYTETMNRVGAEESYFFDKNYFHSFLKNTCFHSKLLLAKKQGVITAAAIFTITNKIMQYHLAGTKSDFIRDTPMKLVLDEARLLGNELGLDFLHLGGGVGGSDEDSLYRFKSGFSDKNFRYKVWKHIVNKTEYDRLVIRAEVDTEALYFPKYRAI